MPLPAFKDRKAPPPAFTAEQAQDVYNFTRDQGQMIKGRNRNPKEQWWVYDNMKPSLAVANEEMVDELDSFVLRSAAPAPPYDIASKPFPMHDKRLDKSDDGWDSPVGKNKAQAKHNQVGPGATLSRVPELTTPPTRRHSIHRPRSTAHRPHFIHPPPTAHTSSSSYVTRGGRRRRSRHK